MNQLESHRWLKHSWSHIHKPAWTRGSQATHAVKCSPETSVFLYRNLYENDIMLQTKMEVYQQQCCFLIADNGLLRIHRWKQCCEWGERSCELWIQIWAHLPCFIPVCSAAPQRAWLDASDGIENGPRYFNLFWPPATFSTSNAVGINPTWPAHNELAA